MLIGQHAPDFAAQACMGDNSFAEVKLSAFKGKHVVLFFWPADFTFVCASEVPGFEKLIKEFESRNCQVLGVSTDTHHVHKAWKIMPRELGGIGEISYPLIGDATKEIAKNYDVLLPNGLCARGVFLIDADGVVQAEHRNNLPLGRNLSEILRLLDAHQFHVKSVADGKPQVCPASWKLGKKGMTPTAEGLVEFSTNGGLDQYV
eukprot:GEMP01092767.1.p1 GENE.GEMP01092767.1~~GEMP01092767.1.p1  ORF type:complete len:218 (+),score=41.50 GEMP01092767.1:45-656(+)